MSKETKNKIRNLFIAGGVLAAYLLFRQYTGFAIPCVFNTVTGLKCPGCGVTRMLTALMHLDIKGAYAANPFLLVTGPFVFFEILYEFLIPHGNKTFHRINNVLLVIYAIALIIFGIIRNLPASIHPTI
ncbi:MAG: DUF2752 domain-containing protein [Lachnospiraceae bacterium]|nr:DUF2752 domain-containing protein [Lachnospiraceae bacterium]